MRQKKKADDSKWRKDWGWAKASERARAPGRDYAAADARRPRRYCCCHQWSWERERWWRLSEERKEEEELGGGGRGIAEGKESESDVGEKRWRWGGQQGRGVGRRRGDALQTRRE